MRALVALCLLTGAALAEERAFVTAQEAGLLAVIDPVAGRVLCTADLGGKPAPLVVDPQSRLAYAVAAESGRLFAVAEDCVIRASVGFDGGPFGVAINPVRDVLYLADWYGARIWELSLHDLGVLRIFPVGKVPAGLAVTDDGALLLVAERDDNSLAILDTETGAVLSRIGVGTHPFGIALLDDRAFTADVESDSVTVVDLASAAVVGTIAVGKRPYAIAFAGDRGFVTDQYDDTVTVFDAGTFEVLGKVEVGEYPEGIDASADGSRVLVANWFSNTLSVIDAEALSVISEIEVPDGPRAFGDFILP
ncbi:MAG: YncE family protein [Paracoccaceae bacterium]